ncbi:MAG: methyl-accepting chemotaxis protein [Oscillospiraceae bacterium]
MKTLFSKFNVNKKFIIVFANIMVATVGSMIILFILLSRADAKLNYLFDKPLSSLEVQLEVRDNINTINYSLLALAASTDASQKDTLINNILESGKVIKEKMVLVSEVLADDTLIASFNASYSEADKAATTIAKLVGNGQYEEAFFTYKDVCIPLIQSLNETVSKIGVETSAQTLSTRNQYTSMKSTAMIIFCILAGIALLITAYIMMVFKSSIVQPLTKLVSACKDLQNGNKIKALHITANDEFGQLGKTFEEMSDNISFIIDDTCALLAKGAAKDLNARSAGEEKYVGKYIELLNSTYAIFSDMSTGMSMTNNIAEQVSTGSTQISAVAQTLSQGTTEQAAAVEELSATVSGIADLSKLNATQADSASTMSAEAAQGVEESNRYMQQMLSAMSEITTTSKEIGKIVKTIDDIAFQTNILSLNAAVEAARAGASGKGFAVVADEVRNLAQHSAEAVKSTTSLVDSTLLAIQNGTSIADATASSLQLVKEKASFVSDAIIKIAEASEHQASATAQVLEGIEQVSRVVQTNSATAEQSAAAAEELASHSKMLTEMTHQYKLFVNDNA